MKNKLHKITAVLLAFMMSAGLCITPLTSYADEKASSEDYNHSKTFSGSSVPENHVLRREISLPTGAEEINAITIDPKTAFSLNKKLSEKSGYSGKTVQPNGTAVYNLPNGLESACADYGYKDMEKRSNTAGRQALYNMFGNASRELWSSSKDLTDSALKLPTADSSEEVLIGYTVAYLDTSELNLTINEIDEVYYTFRNDNPLFYFASNTIVRASDGSAVYYITDADYITESQRSLCNQSIIDGLKEYSSLQDNSSSYNTALAVHDLLNQKIEYSYEADGITPSDDAWAHNIMGAFDTSINEGVCECYARTYQLVLNYLDVENYFVSGVAYSGGSGGGHAWNMVRLDDRNYYYVDCTWDDTTPPSYNYFAKGSSFFNTDHFPNTSSDTGLNFIAALPEASADDYNNDTDTASDTDSVPTLTYEILDDGTIEITGYEGEGRSVTIPDTIDGKTVTRIGDYAFYECSSLTGIEIPDSVTSIGSSAFEGCIDLTIYGHKDSYAEKYANENNIMFKIISISDTDSETDSDIPSDTDTDSETDSDVPSDTDTDTDTDSDTDSDPDSDTDDDVIPADVTGDGKVTIADAVLALKSSLNIIELNEQQHKAADMDKNGRITVADAIIIQKMALKVI